MPGPSLINIVLSRFSPRKLQPAGTSHVPPDFFRVLTFVLALLLGIKPNVHIGW